MALSNEALQAAYTAVKGMGTWVSAHTADPGTTGASEVSGGQYTRVQATLPTGSAGAGTSPTLDIPIPGGVEVKYLGIWSAKTGGTFIGTHNSALSPSLPFPVDGTLTAAVGVEFVSSP